MLVSGTYIFEHPVPRVWAALHDEAVLSGAIPRCVASKRIDADTLELEVDVNTAGLSMRLPCRVAYTDEEEDCRFLAEVTTKIWMARIVSQTTIRLEPDGDGTRMSYATDAALPRVLQNALGQQLSGKLQRIAGRIFERIERAIQSDTTPA